MSDTPIAAPVAVSTKKKAKKPSKAQMRSIVKGDSFRMGVTLMESCLLDALRDAQKASKRRKAYWEWTAWQCLKNDVHGMRHGNPPLAIDLQTEPERFAAVAAILVYLDREQKRAKEGESNG